jgi:ferritin-like metal-binding protein YciE
MVPDQEPQNVKRMPRMTTIEALLADEIKDLYSAEKQLTKALPKMVKGATANALKNAFSSHLAETKAQVDRLEQAARLLGISPGRKKCVGMEGCIREGAEVLEETGDVTVPDLGLAGAATRVEHYEIAGYTMAITLATQLGAQEVVKLLEASLAEEAAADQKLRDIGSDLLETAPRQAAW